MKPLFTIVFISMLINSGYGIGLNIKNKTSDWFSTNPQLLLKGKITLFGNKKEKALQIMSKSVKFKPVFGDLKRNLIHQCRINKVIKKQKIEYLSNKTLSACILEKDKTMVTISNNLKELSFLTITSKHPSKFLKSLFKSLETE